MATAPKAAPAPAPKPAPAPAPPPAPEFTLESILSDLAAGFDLSDEEQVFYDAYCAEQAAIANGTHKDS